MTDITPRPDLRVGPHDVRWQDLPNPEEVYGCTKYTSIVDFRAAGGQDRCLHQGYARFVVSMAPAGYEEVKHVGTANDHVTNAMQAMDLAWSLFTDGGWRMFVWDRKMQCGWSFGHVGPGWTKWLCFIDRNSPGARRFRQLGHEVPYRGSKTKAGDRISESP